MYPPEVVAASRDPFAEEVMEFQEREPAEDRCVQVAPESADV
jgi:hypothetical protein